MALFINNKEHPLVYKNNVEICEPNQGIYKRDFLSERLEEQQEANDALRFSFDQQKQKLSQQSNKINSQLHKIGELTLRHEEFENQLVKWISRIENENKNQQVVLADSLLVELELASKIGDLSQSNQDIVAELEKNALANEEISLKIDEQSNVQNKIANQLFQQEKNHKEVINRLDNQEALTEKMYRQIDYIRSVLFERTHYLAEKIENGYTISSAYIYKLMKGYEKPDTHFKIKKSEKENS